MGALRFSLVLCFIIATSAHAEPKLYFVHSDHLGTPQVLTDENQTIVWKANYTPFGEATVDEDPDGDGVAVEFNLRFPGQYFDKETGTNYNYYRTYDPSLGRYIQSDPIGLNGGLNTYGYVYQNPLIYTDPQGLYTNVLGGLAIRLVGGRAAGLAIQNAAKNAVGPFAGTAIACVLVGVCSSADDGDDNVIPFPTPKPFEEPVSCPNPNGDDGDPCEDWLEELIVMKLAVSLGKTVVDDLTKQALNNSIRSFKYSCPHLANQIGFL